jgi:hypothetical protein
MRWNDNPVFKIGVTSERLGEQRIHLVARDGNLTAKLLLLMKVHGESATSVENRIHNMLCVVPNMGDIDGRTEFRSCSYEKMQEIIDVVEFEDEMV